MATRKRLTEAMKQGIHLMVMNRRATDKEMSELLGVTAQRLKAWRKHPLFTDEFARQLDLYRRNFDDIRLADRKERVRVLDELFDTIPDKRADMKLKVLAEIRTEVGDDKKVVEHHHSGSVGVQLPPRAETYEEWLRQNKQMEAQHPPSPQIVLPEATEPEYTPFEEVPDAPEEGQSTEGKEESPPEDRGDQGQDPEKAPALPFARPQSHIGTRRGRSQPVGRR